MLTQRTIVRVSSWGHNRPVRKDDCFINGVYVRYELQDSLHYTYLKQYSYLLVCRIHSPAFGRDISKVLKAELGTE